MSYLDYIEEKNNIEANIDLTCKPTSNPKIPYTPLFCTPNCQHNHTHSYQNDFWKSTIDARADRPGICFLEGLKNAPLNPNTKNLDNASSKNGLGAKQTPIDLDTNINISEDFIDDAFKFNYEVVDAKKSMKFNDAGDAFFFELNSNTDQEEKHESYFETKTISLFDKHIPSAKLYGM